MTPVAPTPWVAKPRQTSALGAVNDNQEFEYPATHLGGVFHTYARIVHEQDDLPLSLGVPHASIILGRMELV